MSSVASIVPMGPVLSAAMACAASSMLGVALPAGSEVLLDEGRVARLEQVHGPGDGVGPQPVHVLSLCADDGACLGEQCVGIAERALREEVRQDPHHVVAELALVAVDARVEGVRHCA